MSSWWKWRATPRLITKHPEPVYRAARAFAPEAAKLGGPVEIHPLHVAEAIDVLEGRIYGFSQKAAAGGSACSSRPGPLHLGRKRPSWPPSRLTPKAAWIFPTPFWPSWLGARGNGSLASIEGLPGPELIF